MAAEPAEAHTSGASVDRCVQAVLLAGDSAHTRAVRGDNKGYVPIGGRPMIVHVFEALMHTPEVSEVFVVGDVTRLEQTLSAYGGTTLGSRLSKAVHFVPQRTSLYENVWYAFQRTLPPGEPDPDHAILVVPSDIPLVVPEELSDFVEQARARDADYVVGLSPDFALTPFAPRDGQPGIEMACFNLAEGRFRQSNLHYVKPLRMGNRHYIQELYENRYQQELGNMLRLGWRILRREYRNMWVLFYYLLMHVAGFLDRRGFTRTATRVRRGVTLETVERGISALLQTRMTTVTTALGGAALDIDNAEDLDAADKMIDAWKAMQIRAVEGTTSAARG